MHAPVRHHYCRPRHQWVTFGDRVGPDSPDAAGRRRRRPPPGCGHAEQGAGGAGQPAAAGGEGAVGAQAHGAERDGRRVPGGFHSPDRAHAQEHHAGAGAPGAGVWQPRRRVGSPARRAQRRERGPRPGWPRRPPGRGPSTPQRLRHDRQAGARPAVAAQRCVPRPWERPEGLQCCFPRPRLCVPVP
jgi:hypothetical protein